MGFLQFLRALRPQEEDNVFINDGYASLSSASFSHHLAISALAFTFFLSLFLHAHLKSSV